MKFCRILFYEGKKRSIFYLQLWGCGLLLGLFFCFLCRQEAKSLGIYRLDYMNYYIYLLGGMKSYIPDMDTPFQFPTTFLAIHLVGLGLQAYSWGEDKKQMTGIEVIAKRTRKAWWFSKYIWNLLGVFVYYIVIYIGMMGFCRISGGTFFVETSQKMHGKIFVEEYVGKEREICLWMMVISLFIMLVIHSVQLLIVLVKNSVIAFMTSALYMIVSCYFTLPCLIVNYAMMLRYHFVEDGVLSLKVAFVMNSILIVMIWFIGRVIFDKYDFLGLGVSV